VFCTFWSGLDQANPAVSSFLRGNGQAAPVGWPTSEGIEALRQQWLDAPDVADKKKLATEIQRQAFTDLPYLPLGQYFYQSSFKPSITGILQGVPVFWNVKKG
jgi:peptide/nickel transport system substrate-binding protein